MHPIHDIFSDISCWLERRDGGYEYTKTRCRVHEHYNRVTLSAVFSAHHQKVLTRYHRLLVSTGRIPCPTVLWGTIQS